MSKGRLSNHYSDLQCPLSVVVWRRVVVVEPNLKVS